MNTTILRDLGDGLILRQATPQDAEKMVDFQADVHRDPGVGEADPTIAAWVRDLMAGTHPTFDLQDFVLVEDTSSGAIASALCLISQTWTYGGVEFGLGRPELVGTHPDYRRRGLIRTQFELIHRWSADRGELAQAIIGIPWYYRQFDYEMALPFSGGRSGYKPQVPKLKADEQEPYLIRPATEADLPLIVRLYDRGVRRDHVACVWDEILWRYELLGKSDQHVNRRALGIVERAGGDPVGFVAYAPYLYQDRMTVTAYELEPGASWLDVTPSVVRFLWALGEEQTGTEQEMAQFRFALGAEHPAYRAIHSRLPHTIDPYAWYMRVPDLPQFLRRVAPALEGRLAGSPLAGHSGEVKISFYRSGMRLVLEEGRLAQVEPWQPLVEGGGDVMFPDLTFLQLLFGRRSLKELDDAFADCYAANDAARALLEVLFPKGASNVWAIS